MTLDQLHDFFSKADLKPAHLNPHTFISDPHKFTQHHLATLRANTQKPSFLPYYERLIAYKELLENVTLKP